MHVPPCARFAPVPPRSRSWVLYSGQHFSPAHVAPGSVFLVRQTPIFDERSAALICVRAFCVHAHPDPPLSTRCPSRVAVSAPLASNYPTGCVPVPAAVGAVPWCTVLHCVCITTLPAHSASRAVRCTTPTCPRRALCLWPPVFTIPFSLRPDVKGSIGTLPALLLDNTAPGESRPLRSVLLLQ